MSEKHEKSDIIALSEDCLGQRLDKVLATTYPDLSRSRLVALLKSGALCLYDKQGVAVDAAPAMRLRGGESVQLLEVPPLISGEVLAQPVPLDLIHEDDDLLVFNKTAGLVMHPAAGNPDNTVQNEYTGWTRTPRDSLWWLARNVLTHHWLANCKPVVWAVNTWLLFMAN